MDLNNTVFLNEDTPKYKKIWENKEVFPHLHKELGNINQDLKAIGITKVKCFDQISENWEDWHNEKEVVLVTLPITTIINQDGTKTKQHLKDAGIINKEKYLCIDLETEEATQPKRFATYFPTRNLIITHINPFLTKQGYDAVIEDLKEIAPKLLTPKEIEERILEEQYRVSIKQQQQYNQAKLVVNKSTLEKIRSQYFETTQRVVELSQEKVSLQQAETNIKQFITEQLRKTREIPIIKKLTVRDKIYVSFGQIYLTGKVITGTTKKEGIETPIVEPRRVRIGELQFVIGNAEIKIVNPEKIGEYEHPHAKDGKMCYGEADLEAKKLLAELNLPELVNFLYSWALSYNQESAYTKLQTFYDARKKEDAN